MSDISTLIFDWGDTLIGNSYKNDICGAKAVGMTTILITADAGEYPLADYVIAGLSELEI